MVFRVKESWYDLKNAISKPSEEELREQRLEWYRNHRMTFVSNRAHDPYRDATEPDTFVETMVSDEGFRVVRNTLRALESTKASFYFSLWLESEFFRNKLTLRELNSLSELALSVIPSKSSELTTITEILLNGDALRRDYTPEKLQELADVLAIVSGLFDEKITGSGKSAMSTFLIRSSSFNTTSTLECMNTIQAIEQNTESKSFSGTKMKFLTAFLGADLVPNEVAFNDVLPLLLEFETLAAEYSAEPNDAIALANTLIRKNVLKRPFDKSELRAYITSAFVESKETGVDATIVATYMAELSTCHSINADIDSLPGVARKARELAVETSQVADRVSRSLFRLSQLFDFSDEADWVTLLTVIRKQVKNSPTLAEVLFTINPSNTKELAMLKTLVEIKPNALLSTLKKLNTARNLQISISPLDAHQMQSLTSMNETELTAILSIPEEGLSSLEERYVKLRKLNGKAVSTKAIRSLVERYHKASSRGDAAVMSALLKDLDSQFATELISYYEQRLDREMVLQLKRTFAVSEIDSEMIQSDSFLSAYKMYNRLNRRFGTNKADNARAKELIERYLSGQPSPQREHEKNRDWLEKTFTDGGNGWLGEQAREFDITGEILTSNSLARIAQFSEEAIHLLQKLGVAASEGDDAEQLQLLFKNIRRENLNEAEQVYYDDLKVQITALNQATRSAYGGNPPQKVVIKRETDSIETLMMGTKVQGSCLSSDGANFWSTFTNAIDANKGVYWILDENGRTLGRVLVAVDKYKKLLRFPIYYTNTDMNLEPYVNKYLKGLARELGLGLNGNVDDVEKLVMQEWYLDPVRKIN